MEPQTLESCMYHLCPDCQDHAWGPLQREDWLDHAHDVCLNQGCDGRRFKRCGQMEEEADQGNRRQRAAGLEPCKVLLKEPLTNLNQDNKVGQA